MLDDHELDHIVFNLFVSFGIKYFKQPRMGAESASHGPPSFPAEVPSFVCQLLPAPKGDGNVGS